MYVVGEADAFSIAEDARPVLTPVAGGDHFHNSPDAPHAFLPKVGKPIPENWEIAFIAITPRNLKEDTQAVPDDVRAAYKRVVGTEAPLRRVGNHGRNDQSAAAPNHRSPVQIAEISIAACFVAARAESKFAGTGSPRSQLMNRRPINRCDVPAIGHTMKSDASGVSLVSC